MSGPTAAQVALCRDHPGHAAALLCALDIELTRLRAELDEARKDAERWWMLPAFFEEYQINGVKLFNDIDAAIAKEKS